MLRVNAMCVSSYARQEDATENVSVHEPLFLSLGVYRLIVFNAFYYNSLKVCPSVRLTVYISVVLPVFVCNSVSTYYSAKKMFDAIFYTVHWEII